MPVNDTKSNQHLRGGNYNRHPEKSDFPNRRCAFQANEIIIGSKRQTDQ
jgi:hypothetical protein